ncbi:PLP-dependent aminotransferase family protein [Patulibacter sp. NPDC049589]|uniref:MocR-like transcription factor YczR n=1 Tax=Patulibacter sp. NPDC049589 TaxID=3154731 RepID=UPI00342080CA
MTPRSISSASLVRQLGAWRDDERAGSGGDPLYVQLADAIRLLILDGRVPLDVRLPGERELASVLAVSRTTVSTAFGRLREQGHLVSRHGSGSRTSVPAGAAGRGLGGLVADDDPRVIDLGAAALPAAPGVHAAYAAALSALPAHLPGHGYQALGVPELRRALADRYTARGLPTTPAQILVTSGAQHAFVLVLQLLAGPGDRVLIDHPTYPHAIDAIQRASCRPVPVGLPGAGWDVDGVIAALQQTGPRLAYLLPDFHNPTGRCMDPESRARIAAAAARTRTTLVVDETMADLNLDGPPPAPFAAHDPTGAVVITVGGTSKSFWGGLRIGWARADEATIAALAGIRPGLDLGTPIVEQLAATELLTAHEASLDDRREMLRERRDRLIAALATHLPDWRVERTPGGNSLWVELPAPVSSALTASAERHGVRVVPGPRFGVDGAFERFLRLPYTRPAEELEDAVVRLARAYADLRVTPGPRPAAPAAPATAVV